MELKEIKGITEKKIADLNKLSISSVEDLVRHFPRNYLDLTQKSLLSEAYHNDVVLTFGKVASMPQQMHYGKGRKYTKVFIEQEGQMFSVVWFNNPYVEKQLKIGNEYLFYGRVQNKYGQCSMVNPSYELVERNFRLKGIVPVYSLKGGLTQRSLKSMILSALKKEMPDTIIPEVIRRKYALMPLSTAYYNVHSPNSVSDIRNASERIALEEYVALISAFKFIKGDREQVRINRYNCTPKMIQSFAERFGFEFTAGQKNAVNEVFSDMCSPSVMNRLIQGDVGSGKTAVALCAIYIALISGYQVSFVAPTEVLAKQNYNQVCKYLPEFKAEFLSGGVSASEKKNIKKGIQSGDVKIVVGTHAVLTEDVKFNNLALCVCDEQHRFGVSQRNALVEKGVLVDVLVLSATPIPRTLSLIFYGDLDISTIPDKPASRKEVMTRIVPEKKYTDMLSFVENECLSGRQAYFVCPMIDGDEDGSIISATELFDELRERYANLNMALMHGKLKDHEKERIMQDFKDGNYHILVSTTVIEVGVDVPNATIMIIHGAERFGLSQLHQLRGRVGRSDAQSYCFLLAQSESDKSIERLKILKENNDGFKISEFDYNLRGGGDFLGVRQSGRFCGTLGALQYPASVVIFAKKISDEIFNSLSRFDDIRSVALEKYEKIKDVTMN